MRHTPNDVRNVAHLARLGIEGAEWDAYVQDLSRILDFVEQLKAVDTAGIQPMAYPLDKAQRLRPDLVTEGEQRALFQSIAPRVVE